MRLLVTRPEPDASLQAEHLAKLGHDCIVAPLLKVEVLAGVPLDLDGVDALIATSRNALRALASHPQRDAALRLPLFAVGEATAKEASAMGFAEIVTGPGTGEELAAMISERGLKRARTLLHLSGEAIAFDLKSALQAEGFAMRRSVLYRTVPADELPAEALAAIEAGRLDGVILMSPLTGSILAKLIHQHGLAAQMSRLNCYCLSQAVAEKVQALAGQAIVAARPREEDVLALVAARAAS